MRLQLASTDEAGGGLQRALVKDPALHDPVDRVSHELRVARRLAIPDAVEFLQVHLARAPIAHTPDTLAVWIQFRPVLPDG